MIRLRTKMLVISALLAGIPVVLTAYFLSERAAELGQETLQNSTQNHIISIRDAKKQQIEDYFALVTSQIQYYSQDPTTVRMMKNYKRAFPRFLEESSRPAPNAGGPPEPGGVSGGAPVEEYRDMVAEYYSVDFSEEYTALNPEAPGAVAQTMEALDDNSIALQYNYIAANPNPLGTKEELIAARDPSSYTRLHRQHHPITLDYMNRFVFRNIFYVDSETGYIVYSVLKEIDFATSLLDGPYAETNIGEVFRQANQATNSDEVALIDFAPYLPSYSNHTAFIASPVFEGSRKIGVIIFQLPIDQINDIMTYDRSWRLAESGRTGEVIIVSDDYTMRNDSRGLVEDKEGYIEKINNLLTVEMDESVIDRIDRKDTTVGLQKVDNPMIRSALSGVNTFDLYEDYKGDFVFMAVAPINVSGLSWVISSNLSEDEAYETIENLQNGIQEASIPIAIYIVIGGGVLGVLFSYFIIGRPVSILERTVQRVSDGDFTARAEIRSNDELETLSQAFNSLLNDRLTQLAQAEKENETLNNSIIELLKASFQLSQRDLTVQIPVTEDVTGPLADAINQMASETSKVLINVRKISEEVEAASSQVKQQSDNVSKVAENERQIVASTMEELAAATEAMNKIAEVAQSCNEIAAEATRSTGIALDTVNETVNGMGEIRETIHETEKRIKRLGERSQEISGIVDLINNIAERTHVLALNASMQAAAAGEAGRGFSVVADEVQRLAESSRNATSQISALVKNIQVETNDTIATMDRTIGQVVDGSQLAERAGEQMRETQNTTAKLVETVEQIARASQNQARITNELREHAMSIQTSTEETGRQLEEQAEQTDHLVEYSKQLIESIRVFKLPMEG